MALGTAIALGGLALSAKGQMDAKKAAKQANAAAQNAGVNIPEVSRQAEEQALRNIQRSREIENQYSPENQQVRQASMQALLEQLGQGEVSQGLQDMLAGQLGGQSYFSNVGPSNVGATGIGAESYSTQDVASRGANAELLNQAIARAQEELALGGSLPLDVRNLVARTAAARAGNVTGNLGLGRDMTARDLGLTSLQLAQQRLQNAQSLGQAQLGADQFNVGTELQTALANAQARNAAAAQNAQMRQSASQFTAGAQNQASQLNAQLAQQAALANAASRQNASQFDAGNTLNIAQLLGQLTGQDFSRALAGAQFGQSIQSPIVGLDPSAIANLAVGNSNAQQSALQNAAAIRASGAQGTSQLGGQLLGFGLNSINYQPQRTTTLPATTVPTGLGLGSNIPSTPGFDPYITRK